MYVFPYRVGYNYRLIQNPKIQTNLSINQYKQTSRLIRKYETRNMYKACKVATQFLISKGVSEENTLQEAKDMIEKYRKRYKITED